MSSDDDTTEPTELDPGMVEPTAPRPTCFCGGSHLTGWCLSGQGEVLTGHGARREGLAFEAMTKAMLDAGRRYEERMNAATTAALSAANVPGLVAEVERLRQWKAESLPVMAGLQDLGDVLGVGLRELITGEAAAEKARHLLARATSAEQERDDALAEIARLRAGIEAALAECDRADEGLARQSRTGVTFVHERMRALLAGLGEQPGEPDHSLNALCLLDGCVAHGTATAPVVPDSTDVLRERVRQALAGAVVDSEPVNAYASRPLTFGESASETLLDDLTDAVLAVVGQGVTAEAKADGWDEAAEWVADPHIRRGIRQANPYRAVVRSGERGGE